MDAQVKKVITNHVASMLVNQHSTMSRRELTKYMEGDDRDLDAACNYPAVVDIRQYEVMFERMGIAKRVIKIYPEESWKHTPLVYETEDVVEETEFERVFDELNARFQLFSVMERADIVSGIGRYGGILLGLSDGLELSEPVAGVDESTGQIKRTADVELLYTRVIQENHMQIASYVVDPKSARYGMPQFYNIQILDMSGAGSSHTMSVHWSRMIHIADNRTISDVMGVPRLQDVYNNILDLRKLLGGSAEMFWRGAFPGYSFELSPEVDLQDATMDTDAIKEDVEAYANGLKRYFAMAGVTVKALAPQVARPDWHFLIEVKAIAITIGVPYRVFMGSEEAKIASEQDTCAWNGRLAKRQNQYLTPYLVRPMVDRLIAVGVLPEVEDYIVEWPDLNVSSDLQSAEVAGKKTEAMSKYVNGDVASLIVPLDYLTLVLGFSKEEAEEIIKNTDAYITGGGYLLHEPEIVEVEADNM